MSDQQAAPAQGKGPDPTKLHSYALSAEKNLEALATGLAQLGGDEQAVKAVAKMADVCRQLAAGMAKLAHHTPPPAQPEQPAQAQPAQQPQTMGTATDSMQQDLAAKRNQ